MKTINFTNQPDFEVLAAAGIILTCDDNMDYTISEEDYEKLEKEFPNTPNHPKQRYRTKQKEADA